LDDRRLELMDRRVIDVISRLAEEPDRRQLGRGEQRGAVGHANPGAKTRRIRLVHQNPRPGRRRAEPRAGELAHARKHLPHDGAISLSVLRRGERPTLDERLATELHDCVHAAGMIVPGVQRPGWLDTGARGLRSRCREGATRAEPTNSSYVEPQARSRAVWLGRHPSWPTRIA